jgi:CheY-like chemotaxis protein
MPNPHLLLIDDDAQIRRVFTRMLSRHFVMACVGDVRTALGLIDGGMIFDVFLCDLNLPEVSGEDFYDDLKRRSAALAERVVIVTGSEPDEDDAFATALGDRYLRKTGVIRDLVATLTRFAFPRLSRPPAPVAA